MVEHSTADRDIIVARYFTNNINNDYLIVYQCIYLALSLSFVGSYMYMLLTKTSLPWAGRGKNYLMRKLSFMIAS